MHNPRYIVVKEEGEWQIRQAGRHFSVSYSSKTQALCAAIELAERTATKVMTRRSWSATKTIASSPNGFMATIRTLTDARGRPTRNKFALVARMAVILPRDFNAVHTSRLWLTRLGVFLSRPVAFVLVGVFTVLWLVFDRDSFSWEGAAALATLCMTLLIQRAEHRDTQAIHAKLDELLRVNEAARDDLVKLDQEEPEAIERHREDVRAGTLR